MFSQVYFEVLFRKYVSRRASGHGFDGNDFANNYKGSTILSSRGNPNGMQRLQARLVVPAASRAHAAISNLFVTCLDRDMFRRYVSSKANCGLCRDLEKGRQLAAEVSLVHHPTRDMLRLLQRQQRQAAPSGQTNQSPWPTASLRGICLLRTSRGVVPGPTRHTIHIPHYITLPKLLVG